jgi:hypothetical protein
MRTALTNHLEHFRARVVQDALNEASAAHWLRRAAQYEDAARPRPAEWVGCDTTPAERTERRQRMQETAAAFRAKAAVCLLQDTPTDEVRAALVEGSDVSAPVDRQTSRPTYRPAA